MPRARNLQSDSAAIFYFFSKLAFQNEVFNDRHEMIEYPHDCACTTPAGAEEGEERVLFY